MKIYTRTGDDGTTALFGGSRLRKDHARIEAYGTVDEANAAIGAAAALLPGEEWGRQLTDLLRRIQREMFVLGADLATPSKSRAIVPRIGDEHVRALEGEIDALEEDLQPLKRFILPGGTPPSAALHVARTVCRRAERAVVAASESDVVNQAAIRYLNRLSDLLFVCARWANARAGVPDSEWTTDREG